MWKASNSRHAIKLAVYIMYVSLSDSPSTVYNDVTTSTTSVTGKITTATTYHIEPVWPHNRCTTPTHTHTNTNTHKHTHTHSWYTTYHGINEPSAIGTTLCIILCIKCDTRLIETNALLRMRLSHAVCFALSLTAVGDHITDFATRTLDQTAISIHLYSFSWLNVVFKRCVCVRAKWHTCRRYYIWMADPGL